MYNLYVGGESNYNTSVWTAYGSAATGKQDSTMLGSVSGQSIYNGTTAFSSDTQKGTDYSDYNGSIVERYVNNYKAIIESEYGVDVVEARLITKDELISEDIGCSVSSCSSAPSFIYSPSYWSGSAYDTSNVLHVSSSGSYRGSGHHFAIFYGVRPVIILKKMIF